MILLTFSTTWMIMLSYSRSLARVSVLKILIIQCPVISYSKCDFSIDEIEDNGRIMRCGYLELWAQ